MAKTDQNQITLPAEVDSLEKIQAFVAEFGQRHGLSAEAAADLELAVDEACSNIIEHGYRGMPPGEIVLALRSEPGRVKVEIRDQGWGFDPDKIPPPDIHAPLVERTAGGLGWFLIRELMEEVEYRRTESGNTLTFFRHLGS